MPKIPETMLDLLSLTQEDDMNILVQNAMFDVVRRGEKTGLRLMSEFLETPELDLAAKMVILTRCVATRGVEFACKEKSMAETAVYAMSLKQAGALTAITGAAMTGFFMGVALAHEMSKPGKEYKVGE